MSRRPRKYVRAGSEYDEPLVPKGLKPNAIGLVTSTAVGLASTAPAYSLAATLGFVVVVVGVQSPLLVILAFVPMSLLLGQQGDEPGRP